MDSDRDEQRRTVLLETFGCQMNVLDSELVGDLLTQCGFHLVHSLDAARIVLLNTCSVRDHAEHKAWSRLGRLEEIKREVRPELVLGVLGCMAEREGARITARMPHVTVVCGPSHLHELPTLLEQALGPHRPPMHVCGHVRAATDASGGLELLDGARRFEREPRDAQAFVRITRGCNKFCSFCVVPYTRGPEIHRPPAVILDEVRRLADAGVMEVTLVGQTVNHYLHRDGQTTSFADLLWLLHEGVAHLPRLRFVTSYPRDFDDATLQVMAAAPRICRYIHLPVQSGADRILVLMNRGHTVNQYLDLLDRARAVLPDVTLAGDLITGFPTETENEHQASLELLRRARFKSCFVFKYSPRPGTLAARRLTDDVPPAVKRRRNLELLAAQTEISLAHHQRLVGSTVEVLVEGDSKRAARPQPDLVALAGATSGMRRRWLGRTRGDEIVAFDGPEQDLRGRLVTVLGVGATPLTVLGRLAVTVP